MTAIQQVSASLYEAAEMDGAGKIKQFFHITVPSIRPTFWYILMTRFAGALQIFDIIYPGVFKKFIFPSPIVCKTAVINPILECRIIFHIIPTAVAEQITGRKPERCRFLISFTSPPTVDRITRRNPRLLILSRQYMGKKCGRP